MQEYFLNIMGGEWIIIIFVALIVLLGTNRLPDVARKLGKVVGEYNKKKNEVEAQFREYSNTSLNISGPVQNERQKLEQIAMSLGIDYSKKTDEELREIIASKIGKSDNNQSSEKK